MFSSKIGKEKMQKRQVIYLAIDDSGQLIKNDVACYGGIVFVGNAHLKSFLKNYQNLINEVKCRYCNHFSSCDNKCPELKHYNLKKRDRHIFIDYLKNYPLFSCVINTNKIYKSILKNTKSKGRYIDYAIKIMIKNVIQNLVKEEKININEDLELIIFIDESSYKSNGYYSLKESIYKELKMGIGNIKDNINFKNILNANLKVNIYYKNSKYNYLIQCADLITGYVRKSIIKRKNKNLNIIDYQIFLP